MIAKREKTIQELYDYAELITRFLWNRENRRCFYDMHKSADHRLSYETQYGIEF